MPKGIYDRTRPTGFLKPWNEHRVIVGNIGEVYNGRNKREAMRAIHRWETLAKQPHGKASGQKVIYLLNGKTQ